MAEIQPPEGHLNGGGGGPISVTTLETLGPKRQRRPSVRLGEIGGDQLYETHPRRSSNNNKQQWKQHQHQHHQLSLKDGSTSNKGSSSKTRALTNLSASGEFTETLDEDKEVNLDTVAIGSWRVKDSKKRALKRARSNWVSKIDDSGGGGNNNNSVDGDEKYSGEGEDMEDTYREFNVENSESSLKELSPIHSLENLGDGNERNDRELYFNRRTIRARDNHHHTPHGVELSGPSDTDTRDYRHNERCGGGGGEDGVRIWLNSIGLGRYAPVFEIHEVDDEVLPMLTLEDLKDMGISAVGSRRKMFCAIQKLGKGFS